jgi:hypothetical protein
MRKITKADIRAIKWGDHDRLIDSIEFLLDCYEEDKFEAGYKSRIQDEAVVAYKLAEYIDSRAESPLKVDELAKVIEDYFTKALEEDGEKK